MLVWCGGRRIVRLWVGLKEGIRDCGGWNEEGDRAEDPHDDCAEDLVRERLDPKGVGVGDVVRVDRAVAEGEEGRKRCIDEVGADQIEKDAPVVTSACGGPGAQDAPPKEQRSEEEADVLEVVPVFVFEGEVVGGGNVPERERSTFIGAMRPAGETSKCARRRRDLERSSGPAIAGAHEAQAVRAGAGQREDRGESGAGRQT